ncbi:MAG: TolB family protein [Gemmatimonadales bacterium]
MKRVNIALAVATIGLMTISVTGVAQRASEPTGPNIHKLLSVDSASVRPVELSPNGRWLAIGMQQSIWIAPADGHGKPVRLLSPGYVERTFEWFASSDRLVFASNRASRDGSNKMYAMTVAIDPNTGQAVGQPRQVTTEEIVAPGSPSPDGQWVTYLPFGGNEVRAVPATGGTPRTLATMDHAHLPIRWSRDGKTVFFIAGATGAPPSGVAWRVPFAGGPVTRAYSDSMALLFGPNTDLHVVPTRKGSSGVITHVDLLDARDRPLGGADLPTGMSLWLSVGAANGFLGSMSQSRTEAHLFTLGAQSGRTFAPTPVNGWMESWTGDGAGMVLVEGKPGGVQVVVLDTSGHVAHQVTLPEDARTGYGVVGNAMPFWRGLRSSPVRPRGLYMADVRSGEIREVAPRVELLQYNSIRMNGRGGGLTDGDRFLIPTENGSTIELRAFTADGHSTLIRAFQPADSVFYASVHGERVAWAIRSRDSVRIFAARSATAPAQHLLSLPRAAQTWFEMKWSNEGDRLAVNGAPKESSISVLRVDADGGVAGPVTRLNANATDAWSVRWTRDDRSILFIATPAGSRDEAIIRVSATPGDPSMVIKAGDGVGDDDFFPSPDGKHIAYPSGTNLGASVWRVDFLPPRRP